MLTAICVLLTLLATTSTVANSLALASTGAAAAIPSLSRRGAVLAQVLVFVLGISALHHFLPLTWWLSAAIGILLVGPSCLGWAVRLSFARHDRDLRRLEDLERQTAAIRVDERSRLASEVHGIVVHHLSVLAVQLMAYRDSDDPAELGRVVRVAGAGVRAALGELRTLVGVLRTAGEPEPAGSTARPDLVRTVDELLDLLADHGYAARAALAPEVATAPESVRRTAERVLREAVSNVVHHGGGSRCDIAVSLEPADREPADPLDQLLRVRVANDAPARPGAGAGLGLMALQERVALVGGRLTTETGPPWVITATLPWRG